MRKVVHMGPKCISAEILVFTDLLPWLVQRHRQLRLQTQGHEDSEGELLSLGSKPMRLFRENAQGRPERPIYITICPHGSRSKICFYIPETACRSPIMDICKSSLNVPGFKILVRKTCQKLW